MIKSFGDKETEKIYYQQFSRKLPQAVQRIALRKMIMMDAARCLDDLRVPPANHLELLQGDYRGFYSIRINNQYRLVFNCENSDIYKVTIVDYH
ncbi:MAG: type II toxin-antitoxin system RelE/ParE family toxin [Phascolarctobacterium sp.]|nr:type II toxin-antitoxin system RelE/ParE family toxin [Candidatus Phascolarctobacterium equi]